MTYPTFQDDIEQMNARYELAPITLDLDSTVHRLDQFQDILDKEFNELQDLDYWIKTQLNYAWPEVTKESIVHGLRVQLADLLGDIMVYCTSEATRWGIPIDKVLELIMASNTSKLGADGQPIKNPVNGKFEKGPNYWKPEPAISHLLQYGGDNVLLHKNQESGVMSVELIPQMPPTE